MAQDIELHFPSGIPRLLVGLLWEPNEQGEKYGEEPEAHNLDLSCAILSRDLKLLDVISPSAPKREKYGEQIFHVGDNLTGGSDFEDEHIRVDFDKLDEEYAILAFFVTAHNNVRFKDVKEASCVFSDATSLHPFLSLDLADIAAEVGKSDLESDKHHILVGTVSQIFPGEWSIINVQAVVDSLTMSSIERVIRETCL